MPHPPPFGGVPLFLELHFVCRIFLCRRKPLGFFNPPRPPSGGRVLIPFSFFLCSFQPSRPRGPLRGGLAPGRTETHPLCLQIFYFSDKGAMTGARNRRLGLIPGADSNYHTEVMSLGCYHYITGVLSLI